MNQCSKECGGGEQYRKAMCLRGGAQAPIENCDEELVPDTYQVCNVGPCNKGNKVYDPLGTR